MRLLVSACLLGLPTRYDATAAGVHLGFLCAAHTLVPVCPEQLGGLPTPRPACEICQGRIMTKGGLDCTAAYQRGAAHALGIYRLSGCDAAILKRRSPSCGKGLIYDGSFTHRLVPGNGVTAALLLTAGVPVYGEDETSDFG